MRHRIGIAPRDVRAPRILFSDHGAGGLGDPRTVSRVPEDWIALTALALSVFSLWLQYGARNRADVIVSCERRETTGGNLQHFLVLHNSGAADARDVRLKLRDNGRDMSRQIGLVKDDQPIPIIASRHEVTLVLMLGWSDSPLLESTVSWRDRRPFKRYSRSHSLSTTV
jgi:hypothetical protein